MKQNTKISNGGYYFIRSIGRNYWIYRKTCDGKDDEKVDIHKSGCYWTLELKRKESKQEKLKRSFYGWIKEKEIVFGIREGEYKYAKTHEKFEIGSIVLITEGYNVKAISKITSPLIAVTSKPELKNKLKEYEIPYEDWVVIYQGIFYELKPNEQFQYKCQQGIVRVRKLEILEKVINILNQEEVYRVLHP